MVVFDIYTLLKMSRLLPSSYIIEDCFQIKSLTLCANSIIRGVFTSDNEYDFVTLPPDMRFKFSFDINRWPDYFKWVELPSDLNDGQADQQLADERARQLGAKASMKAQAREGMMTKDARSKMGREIDDLLTHKLQETSGRGPALN